MNEENNHFEELIRERYGDNYDSPNSKNSGGSGKKHPEYHGKKTNNAIIREQNSNAHLKREEYALDRIYKVLLGFPEHKSRELEDRYIDNYLNWLKNCFQENKLKLDPKNDIRLEFSRSSSHGGQNVNKVETAVKAIHEISGISCHNEENRSQSENREASLKILISKIQNHLKDWKEYLDGKEIKSITRYDILEMIEDSMSKK
jgi:hypothetical protein